MQLRPLVRALCVGLAMIGQQRLQADDVENAREFFESRIRPALVEYCYECHNSSQREGGLALDSRAGVQSGGDRQKELTASGHKRNLILEAIRHESEELKMPEGGAKLSPQTVADFEKWFAAGAVDPRDSPPSAEELAPDELREMVFAERSKWWAWQPLLKIEPPVLDETQWPTHAIDRFTFATMREHGLTESSRASSLELLRRLSFALVGLPPSARELAEFETSSDPNLIDKTIDRLLASPQFGERWARHWMDWLRYSESHGSEGDPAIPYAYQYRDYLIRALNDGVPFDRLVTEHVAGDLLAEPRLNSKLRINESSIGPAHLRMVFHGFAPTDALEEKVRFVDDQLATLSKAFLGMTVACARCHDHKFDAIRQKDYYALSGILGSCHPGIVDANAPELQQAGKIELAKLKPQIRQQVADHWHSTVDEQFARLMQPDPQLVSAIDAAKNSSHPLYIWKLLHADGLKELDRPLRPKLVRLLVEYQKHAREVTTQQHAEGTIDLKLANWFAQGNGTCGVNAAAGEFTVASAGERLIDMILPAGRFSHLLSTRHRNARLSPRVELNDEYDLWLLVAGEGDSSVRYVVQDYPRNGTVYPVNPLNSRQWRWQKFDLDYWKGDAIHVELATAGDAPVLVKPNDRSWFGIRSAKLTRRGTPAPPTYDYEQFAPLVEGFDPKAKRSARELVADWSSALERAIQAWRDDSITDSQAMWLNSWLEIGLLPATLQSNDQADNTQLGQLVRRYRNIESNIPLPTRVPGVWETAGMDQPLYLRGDHRQAAENVPRGFVSVLDAHPYQATTSGRLELAESLTGASKPLLARVIVNRLWHHLFGRGLVATPDNFGKLGSLPTHSQLLDYLAQDLIDNHWSLKHTIRLIVTSHTWQQTSRVESDKRALDPDNLWLARAPLRRLEAEAIRDAQLAVADQLDTRMFGASVESSQPRRSVYLRVFRNSLDPELRVFDFPEPTTTMGRRDVTNVPAQSLLLLNNPQVRSRARAWAQRTLDGLNKNPVASENVGANSANEQQLITTMFRQALARSPKPDEVEQVLLLVRELEQQWQTASAQREKLNQQLVKLQRAEDALLQPAIERLQGNQSRSTGESTVVKNSPSGESATIPTPIATWEFEASSARLQHALTDSKAQSTNATEVKLSGELVGKARLERGALIADGGFLKTAPLPFALRAKTLEVWVQVSDLTSRGGGVMTIQTSNGETFDSIVLGEQKAGEWLAGSNVFARTKPFNAPAETVTSNFVHLAITYGADGRVTGYRNGQPYGESYLSAGLQNFEAGDTVITFGLRHLPAGGNRHLEASWERARLYDRALSAAEVASSFRALPHRPTESQLIAELSSDQRDTLQTLRAQREQLRSEVDALARSTGETQEISVWTDVALALLNTKEFIFIR